MLAERRDRKRREDRREVVLRHGLGDRLGLVRVRIDADALEEHRVVALFPADHALVDGAAGRLESAAARRRAGEPAHQQKVAAEHRVVDLEEVAVRDLVHGQHAALGLRAPT